MHSSCRPMSAEERLVLVTAKEDVMKLWKFNKRSSTLADMSMNRVLLTELIAKGALVGVIAGFFGASYRYLILE